MTLARLAQVNQNAAEGSAAHSADSAEQPGIDLALTGLRQWRRGMADDNTYNSGQGARHCCHGCEALVLSLVPGATVLERDWANMKGAFTLRPPTRDGFAVLASANVLALDPRIQWAEPDMVLTAREAFVPNDPGFPNCWGIQNTGQLGGIPGIDMSGPAAWDISTGSATVKVLVLDGGVQRDPSGYQSTSGGGLHW